MIVTRYNGTDFLTLGLSSGYPSDSWQGPDIMSNDLTRPGANPVHVGVDRGPRQLTVTFGVMTGYTVEQTILKLLGAFDPLDESERVLEGKLNDGTTVNAYAVIGNYRGNGVNHVDIDFTLADPVWWSPSTSTIGTATWDYTLTNVVTPVNPGQARSNMIVRILPTTSFSSTWFRWRRQFTVTNLSDTPLRRWPCEVDLGNMSTWSGPPLAGQLWLSLDGLAQPATFLGFGLARCFMWFLINELAPGASATYDLAWNKPGASALTGTDLPAFDLTNETGTGASFTANTMTVTGATWETNQWARARVWILTGTGAGQQNFIASNTGNVITTVNNFSPTPGAGATYLLRTSVQERWIYAVRQTERSSPRGIWWLNRGQSKPSRARFDVPGGWYRMLYNDNNDEKTQQRWLGMVPKGGGGTPDFYSILNVYRTAQGWARLLEEGQADAVAFSSPIPILAWRFNFSFQNPNGVAWAFFGSRESGAEDYESVYESTTASTALVDYATNIDTTFATDTRHLIAHLGPLNGEEIPTSWIRDTGSRSGGGTVTFYDDSKSWTPGQWVNGRIRIVSGTGAGQSRSITASDVDNVTITPAWTRIPSDDSRYEITNKRLLANLRALDMWEVRNDTTKVTVSAVGSELTTYALEADFRYGGGTAATAVAPYQTFRIGLDRRECFLTAGEELRIDGKLRRASVYNASGVLVRDLTDHIRVLDVTPQGSFYAADWLLAQPDVSPATNPSLVFPILAASENYLNATVTVTIIPGWHG